MVYEENALLNYCNKQASKASKRLLFAALLSRQLQWPSIQATLATGRVASRA